MARVTIVTVDAKVDKILGLLEAKQKPSFPTGTGTSPVKPEVQSAAEKLAELAKVDFSSFKVAESSPYFATIRQFMGSCESVASGKVTDPKVGAKALVEYSILHPEILMAPAVAQFKKDWPQFFKWEKK